MNLEVTETEVRLIKKLLKKHLLHVKTEITLVKIFDLQNKLNNLTIPVVSKSVTCEVCDGYGYTVDVYGRRDKHCTNCE